MATSRTSRSAMRTKQHIVNVFFSLLEHEDYSRITVTDIVNSANIARGTFYAYFHDAYDIVEQIEEEALRFYSSSLDEFLSTPLSFDTLKQLLFSLYDYTQQNIYPCRRIFACYKCVYGNHLLKSIRSIFMEKIFTAALDANFVSDVPAFRVWLYFTICGWTGSLYEWLCDGTQKQYFSNIDTLANTIWNSFSVFQKTEQ